MATHHMTAVNIATILKETAFESTGRSVDGQASPADNCDLPNTCSDGDRLLHQLSSTELYPGSPVPTRESLLLFSSLAECHNLFKTALSDTLQVVCIHLPHRPQQLQSVHKFYKAINTTISKPVELVVHYLCLKYKCIFFLLPLNQQTDTVVQLLDASMIKDFLQFSSWSFLLKVNCKHCLEAILPCNTEICFYNDFLLLVYYLDDPNFCQLSQEPDKSIWPW